MNLILLTAVLAVCGAAKLDRTYLPPASAKTAGGSPGSLQTPFAGNSLIEGASNLPKGSFTNDFQGVVVDAAAAGTRATGEGGTGLGGPRVSYGSTDSRVGDAAFRDAPSFRPFPGQESNKNQEDGQTASSQVSSEEFNRNKFAPRVESKPERSQAASDRAANTLRYENEVGPDSYHYAYDTDNGISAEENGVAANGVQAQGGYSYTGDDGLVYSITYIADEGGYQPRGDHLPTPPPIPEEILKALEKNAEDEAAGFLDDGSYDAQRYNAGSNYAESDSGNTEYNDRQTPKFGKRPESDATASGTFINQNNQAYRPNLNEQLRQKDSSENSQGSTNDFISSSSVENFRQSTQPGSVSSSNSFGSRKEYSPSNNGFNQNGRPQGPFTPSSTNATQFNGFNDNSQTFTYNGQTQNYQGSQHLSNFERPGSNRLDVLAQSASKENSLESNKLMQSSNNFAQVGQTSQNSGNTFGSRTEYLPPVTGFGQNVRTQTLRPQRPTASAEVTTTPSFNTFSQNTGSFQSNNDASVQSSPEFGSGSQSAEQFSSFQQTPQSFNNKYSQNRFQSPQVGQNPREGQSDASISSVNFQRPTSLPSTELTTPFESNEQTQSSSSGSSITFNAFNSQKNTHPAHRYTSQNNGQFISSSTKAQGSSSSSERQNQFNRPSFSSNQQSSEESHNENVHDVNDVQFAPSTVRPTFGQAQGTDDSYYYRQPSKPFNSLSGSRFPGASSSQFNRVSLQSPQSSSHFSTESQENSFQTQNNYNRGTNKYPEPTLTPTTASQYTEASISTFQPLNQGTTKYPRPPTLPTTVPTQYNGITQATASSFTSVPTSSVNSRPSNQEPSQFNYQSQPQGLSQFSQDTSSQISSQGDSSPQVATQQYSGEIYEYSKPTQGLPAPGQKESSSSQLGQNIPEPQPTRSQFDSTQGSSNVQEYKQQPTGSSFGTRPQIDSQRPQFGSQFSFQDQPPDSRPQFNSQSSIEGSQEYQGKPVGVQNIRSKCCQSLDSRLQSYRGVTQSTGPVPTQSLFGAQFTGPTAQTVSQSSGFGEDFGGPRQPPSFNQETGYHY